jgi:hypothetical protein
MYNDNLFAYWRMVLVEGPAFGDNGIFQLQFNLIDPDNQSPLLETAFTDDVDGVLPVVTIGAPGNPFQSSPFTDGDTDVMTTTVTIIPNLSLSVAFADGDNDVMNTWGSFYPSRISQTMVVVKGK